MARSFSLPLLAVFLASNWVALMCELKCHEEAQPSAGASMSRPAGHEHHALDGPDAGQPLVSAADHICGTHAAVEPLFAPERVVQPSGLAASAAAMLLASPCDRMPHPGERVQHLRRPWQAADSLSGPFPFSLRI